MHCALWTCCLIFMENFFLLNGRLSGRIIEITSDSELQKSVAPVDVRGEETEDYKITFEKLSNIIRQRPEEFVQRSTQEEVSMKNIISEKPLLRHQKHANKRRNEKHDSTNIRNKPRNFTDPISSQPTTTVRDQNNDHVNGDIMLSDEVPLSPVSQHKLQTLGTEEAVREEFQKRYHTLPASIKSMELQKQKFKENYDKMTNQTVCHLPLRKVVRVSDIYPEMFKEYYPTCTILHQCSNESGCCPKKTKCAPYKTENVTLYFEVLTRTSKTEARKTYESLTFSNHTQCKCVEERVKERGRPARDTSYSTPSESLTADDRTSNNIRQFSPCRCPLPFSSRVMANGSCFCDCYDKQSECIRFKKGLEYFSFKDKLCLMTKQCIYPTCNYGEYLNKYGRCPKIEEKHLS